MTVGVLLPIAKDILIANRSVTGMKCFSSRGKVELYGHTAKQFYSKFSCIAIATLLQVCFSTITQF